LRQAHGDIRRELSAVATAFRRAKYDSDANPLPWTAYYFYLQGRPVHEHLAACPKTAQLLARIPHNGLHVCFSALPPGGSLHPHTGPTNASLTAHLGLADCDGATLHVAGHALAYSEGDVLVFDDSFVHWVEHTGSRVRYTLMVTFWHPELHVLERGFLGLVLRTGGNLAP
jgi:aspartyl/asparaginyl beta-hydroxylase (cupin superfamily)